MLAGQAGQSGASVLLLIAISRALPPAQRGEFVLLTLLPQLGVYLVTLGLPAAALYQAAHSPGRRRAVAGLSLAASGLAGVLLTAVAPPLFELTGVDRPPWWLLLLANTAVSWVVFASWMAYGIERHLVAGALRALPIAAAAGAVAIAHASGGVTTHESYSLWVAPHVALAFATTVYAVWRYGLGWPTGTELRAWLWYSIRGSATHVTDLVALRFDQWLLGALGTTAAVGIYSIAASLSEAVLLIGRSVGVVILVDAAARSDPRLLRRQVGATVTLACLAALALALLAEPLVDATVGPEYGAAARLTQILLLGTPGLMVARLVSNWLAGAGRPGRGSLYNGIAAVLTIGLDFVLIPSHGAHGAAWASVVGYTSAGLVALLELRRLAHPPVESSGVTAP